MQKIGVVGFPVSFPARKLLTAQSMEIGRIMVGGYSAEYYQIQPSAIVLSVAIQRIMMAEESTALVPAPI